MGKSRVEYVSLLLLIIGVSLLAFFVFQPFIHIFVLAMVLSVLFQPLYKKLLHWFGGGKNFFAVVIVFIVLIFIIIPVLFFGLQILNQAQNFFSLSNTAQHQYIQSTQQAVESVAKYLFPSFSINISDYISKVLIFIESNLIVLISGTAYVFLQIFFLLITFFFFLRDGEDMMASFATLSPFGKEQNRDLLDPIHRTITSVIRGTLFTGLIRWALMAIGFYFFGIQNSMLWASLGGIIGAVPGLGTPFAIIPAVIYLFVTGDIIPAVGMVIFGLLIMFFVDNMLSLYFFGKGLEVHSIFVLFSIIGGLVFFGPLGFIFGPIVLSLFISVLEMYKILILKKQ